MKDYLLICFCLMFCSEAYGTRNLAIKPPTYASILPSAIENCFLTEYRLKTDTIVGCFTLCRVNPSCFLACKSGPRCRLYSALVSPQWDKSITTTVNPILFSFTCFSFWAKTKGIAGNATFTESAPGNTPYVVYKAADGFGCPPYNGDFFLHTRQMDYAWLLADLGSIQTVDRVVIQTRGNIGGYTNFFDAVQVSIGNETQNGNFESYTVLMYYAGPSAIGEIVTFKREKALVGRYVAVQNMKPAYILVINEMKIISI